MLDREKMMTYLILIGIGMFLCFLLMAYTPRVAWVVRDDKEGVIVRRGEHYYKLEPTTYKYHIHGHGEQNWIEKR